MQKLIFFDFIQEAQIEDEENFTSIYGFNGKIQPSFDFKIQPKKLCMNHCPVKASSGVIYFLDELIEILKLENPVYLITGRPLTDKIEYFTDFFKIRFCHGFSLKFILFDHNYN